MSRKYNIFMINGTERLTRPVSDENATVMHYATTKDLFTGTTRSPLGSWETV